MLYASLNPATEEKFAEYPCLTDAELEETLQASWQAFSSWRGSSLQYRAEKLFNLAGLVEKEKNRLARLITDEVGKPVAQSEVEVARVVSVVRYLTENAATLLREERLGAVTEKEALVRLDPLGIVFAITPWNYPVSLATRAVFPALLSGNAVLLKPAPNVPGTTLLLQELIEKAGFPEYACRTVFLSNEQAGKVIEDTRIRMVSFTGSVAAGREVGKRAGAALKKTVLELGGNDAFIVRQDADPLKASEAAYNGRINNAGQICCAPKRFLVHKTVLDPFREHLSSLVESTRTGNPLLPETRLGPLARSDLRDNLRREMQNLIESGARIRAESSWPRGKGFFFPATVLELQRSIPCLNTQELFGPVLPIVPFQDDAQAVEIANSSPFGLAASIFSEDRGAVERIIPLLDCGVVCVNCCASVDPRIPFGGVKDSGFGRAYGPEGLHENANCKTVVFAPSA